MRITAIDYSDNTVLAVLSFLYAAANAIIADFLPPFAE